MPQSKTKNTQPVSISINNSKWEQGHHHDDQATTHPQFQPLTEMDLESVSGSQFHASNTSIIGHDDVVIQVHSIIGFDDVVIH